MDLISEGDRVSITISNIDKKTMTFYVNTRMKEIVKNRFSVAH